MSRTYLVFTQELDEYNLPTGKMVLSHGVDEETGNLVITDCETFEHYLPYIKRDMEKHMWYLE